MPRSVKTRPVRPSVVGVIASRADLNRLLRLRRWPDLFELRLDCLVSVVNELDRQLSVVSGRRGEPMPLIITARDPREGGANKLSIAQRRELLFRFLPRARHVDVELRSAKRLKSILDLAREKNLGRILSFHDFQTTPTSRSLRAMAGQAKSLGADIFKIATRTDTPLQLARLIDFVASHDGDLPLSVMGIGKLGRASRREFMQCGSVLNYAGLRRTNVSGQPTLQEIRRWTSGARY